MTASHSTETVGKYRNLTELRKANHDAGQHWFAPDAMRFFHTRIHGGLQAGAVFVTSDRIHGDEIAYSVRIATADGNVETLGTWGAHSDLAVAMADRDMAARILRDLDRTGGRPLVRDFAGALQRLQDFMAWERRRDAQARTAA